MKSSDIANSANVDDSLPLVALSGAIKAGSKLSDLPLDPLKTVLSKLKILVDLGDKLAGVGIIHIYG